MKDYLLILVIFDDLLEQTSDVEENYIVYHTFK